MSDVRHRIFVGADTQSDIDDSFTLDLWPPFTFDRTDIYFDTRLRFFDETHV